MKKIITAILMSLCFIGCPPASTVKVSNKVSLKKIQVEEQDDKYEVHKIKVYDNHHLYFIRVHRGWIVYSHDHYVFHGSSASIATALEFVLDTNHVWFKNR